MGRLFKHVPRAEAGAAVASVVVSVVLTSLKFVGYYHTGSSAILSDAIHAVLAVEWRDFAPHFRLTRLRVENLGPLTVGIDARGQSRYQALEDEARSRLPAIMARLSTRRQAATAAKPQGN